MKVAVVSGSNKGIGFAIVRGLCKEFDGHVYLTARDVQRGEDAVKTLEKEGLKPKFHQLDILDNISIQTFKTFLLDKYGGLDLLVNNVGINIRKEENVTLETQTAVTMDTNYNALLTMCDELFPLLRPGARVVHVSSNEFITFLKGCSEEVRNRVTAASCVDEVSALMKEYCYEAKYGNCKKNGWTEYVYGVSKAGVTAITLLQQVSVDTHRPGADIVINSCSPGYVKTDMTNYMGYLTPDEGAKTPLYLGLLPPNTNIKGCYCFKKICYDWRRGEYPDFQRN